MRASLIPVLLLLTTACQEPFGTDRHDLVGFRIAALSAVGSGDTVSARAALIVDGHPWSDDAVTFDWYWVDDTDADTIAALGEGDLRAATGPTPDLPANGDAAALALVATHGEDLARAVVEVGEAAHVPALNGIDLRSNALALESVQATDLHLAARRLQEDGPAASNVPEGGFARLRAQTIGDPQVRWMTTAPGGTFLELDRQTTDWAAGTLHFDEDEIEEATPDAPAPHTFLALALSEELDGANAWAARDVYVGSSGQGVLTNSQRWLPVDRDVLGPYVQGVLVADDASPTGLALQDARDVEADVDPGTATLTCRVAVEGYFDPTWLLDQRCTRSAVVGQTIVVVIR